MQEAANAPAEPLEPVVALAKLVGWIGFSCPAPVRVDEYTFEATLDPGRQEVDTAGWFVVGSVVGFGGHDTQNLVVLLMLAEVQAAEQYYNRTQHLDQQMG